jgi:hypothetical protein
LREKAARALHYSTWHIYLGWTAATSGTGARRSAVRRHRRRLRRGKRMASNFSILQRRL